MSHPLKPATLFKGLRERVGALPREPERNGEDE